MLAISLLGVTPGLEVATFGNLSVPLVDDWVGISSSEIELPRDQSLYYVSRRTISGGVLTWIGYYQHALGLGGSRDGGYHGAGIWLLNKTTPGDAIVRLLPLLTSQVSKLAMSNGQFVKRLANIRDQIQWPDVEGKRVSQSLTDLGDGGGLGTGDLPRGFLDLSSPDHAPYLGWFLDWVQCGRLFNGFSRIMISADQRVVDSACTLGRLQVVTPGDLLAQDAAQRVSDATRLAKTRTQVVELERACAEVKAENNRLQQDAQRICREQADWQTKEQKWQADYAAATSHAQKLLAERDHLKQRMSECDSARRTAEAALAAIKRETLNIPLQGMAQSPLRRQLSRPGASGGIEPPFCNQALETDKQMLEARIHNLEQENARLVQARHAAGDEVREPARPWYGSVRHLGIMALVGALALVGYVEIIMWVANRPVAGLTLPASSAGSSAKSTCDAASVSSPRQRWAVDIRQAMALEEVAKIIQAHACQHARPQCTEADTRTVADAIRAAGPVNAIAGVEFLPAAGRFAVSLPVGCNAANLEDGKFSMFQQADNPLLQTGDIKNNATSFPSALEDKKINSRQMGGGVAPGGGHTRKEIRPKGDK